MMKLQSFLRLACTFVAASAFLAAAVSEQKEPSLVFENSLVQEPSDDIASETPVEIEDKSTEEPTLLPANHELIAQEDLDGREPVGVLAEPEEVREAEKQTIQEQLITDFKRYKDTRGRSPNPAGPRASMKAAMFPKHPDTITYVANIQKTDNGFWSLPSVTVELEDTSLWSVRSLNESELKTWKKTDQLVVTENNKKGFSDEYEYRLINQNTGGSVPVNLKGAPINPKRIDRIIRVETSRGFYDMIFLNDGTQMEMTSYDVSITSKWAEGDVIIVGVHSGALRGGNPNLLINSTRLTAARGALVAH